MGIQDAQSLDDDRESLTLFEMSPVEPILTVVMPDQHLMGNMSIMTTEMIANDLDQIPDAIPIEIDPVEQILSDTLVMGGNGKKKPRVTVRKTRAKKQVDLVQPEPEPALESSSQSLLACDVCSKNFVSISRLKSHEKTHSKSRPFTCIDCGKTFTVRYSLICHTRVHTRERPYNCGTCGARFSQASSLKTHQIYKHTKEFPYLCKVCGRGFISPGQRHEHVARTHLRTGSKPVTPGRGRKKKPLIKTDTTLDEPPVSANGSNDQGVQTQLSLPPGPIY